MNDVPKIPNSMLKPSLEYLHQYAVDKVRKNAGGWSIVFENGAEITNTDPRIMGVKLPKGVALLTTVYAKDSTTLIFGRVARKGGQPTVEDEVKVELNPLEYKIIDPRFQDESFPQRGEDDDS